MDLNKYIDKITYNDLPMDSLIIYKNGGGYEINKKREDKINVKSVAKTVMAIACGILIEVSNYDFNEDTYIYPIIKDKIELTNKKNLKYLEKLQVKHLLTHTVGYRDMILMSKELDKKPIGDILNYAINYPIYYKAGTYFLYSNAGMYLLAVTMSEYLGYDLYEFINKNLFMPLDIKKGRRERYGKYIAASTKLYLNADDMLKIGKLILNKGKYEGKGIVSADRIDKITTKLYRSHKEIKYDNYISDDYYGYGIWISDKDIIFASGTGGQFIVIIKDLDTVIIATNEGDSNKSHEIRKVLDKIIAYLYGEIDG